MDDSDELRVMVIDRPGVAHDALTALLGDIKGVRLVTERDAIAVGVVVVDDRLVHHGHALARRAGARLIVVGVDDNPGYADRARRLGARWVAKERAASILPALLGPQDRGAVQRRDASSPRR